MGPAPWRSRLAWLPPFGLFVLALAAVVALPLVAFGWTDVRSAGGFATTLGAHVGWSRLVALGLALGAAVMLGRLARRDPRAAGRACVAILVVGGVVSVAAATPALDDAVEARMRARYASAEGWGANDPFGDADPEHLSFTMHLEAPDHRGELTIPMPPLRKGDEYGIMVAFEADAPEGFWRSQISHGPAGQCASSERMLPRGHPDDATLAAADSILTRDCTASGAGDRGWPLQAWWGAREPVTTRVSAVVRPTFDNVVLAGMDVSLLLVAVPGALLAHVAYAHGVARARAPPPGAAFATLALAPVLACAAWAAAALVPSTDPWGRAPPFAASLAFAALALAAGAFGAWRIVAAARAGTLRDGRAVAHAALAALAVAAVAAPVATLVSWGWSGPWATLGIGATALAAIASFHAARRLARGSAAPAAA